MADDSLKTFTAKAMRELTQKTRDKAIDSELKKCLNAVNEAVAKGELSVVIYNFYASDATINELKSRGFIVKTHRATCQRDDSYTMLNW